MASDDPDINADTYEELYQKGMKYYRNKEYKTAISYFDQALSIDPNFESALNSKGIALYQMGQFDKATSIFDQILTINPSNQEALKNWQAVLKMRSSSMKNAEPSPHKIKLNGIILFALIIVIFLIIAVVIYASLPGVPGENSSLTGTDQKFARVMTDYIGFIQPIQNDITISIQERNLTKIKLYADKSLAINAQFTPVISGLVVSKEIKTVQSELLNWISEGNFAAEELILAANAKDTLAKDIHLEKYQVAMNSAVNHMNNSIELAKKYKLNFP